MNITKQKKLLLSRADNVPVTVSVPRKLAMLQLAFDYSIGAIDKKLFHRERDRMHLEPAENDYLTGLLFKML